MRATDAIKLLGETMSGHSKWATIKRKKAAVDAKRGKEFTKLIKEITVAARLGGGDANGNPRLRLLLDKAKEVNMPLDNTMRAVKRGTGELPGTHYEPQQYEGYGPGGIAVIVDTLSDNKNRTVAELRHVFSSKGGSLAETGAVGWMFKRMGVVRAIESQKTTEDFLLEQLIEFDIQDISIDEDHVTITCDPKSLEKVKQAMSDLGLKIDTSELEWVAQNTVALAGDSAQKAEDFLSELEDHDDVQEVFTNYVEGVQ